ncbi:acetate kinase [Plantactinospora sp. S1510]|uniref:Acetate kinase n=1 Tax=Plantactinospora alkalitolerans TaxID=2789879 RepID=A0ABS0GYL7_9ACTN|nr:acetate kinase [Plantactinospora alkalitolerans]MBF9131308.1 acetate kinase [Plantactinospora alkalitolerans]
MTRVLVLNCGSSSLKYRIFDGDRSVDRGLVERIGEPGGGAPDHSSALRDVLAHADLESLDVVGHRVVHGGADFTGPTVVDDEVVAAIERLVPLAPLHNPANLTGIAVARRLLPGVPQVAVFDTAFHATLPPAAATYAVDIDVARRLQIRRYGFHGTSHAYVARHTARLLGRPPEGLDLITLHLGNGASACAVSGGRSVATSMGLSPLAGLVMGTRSGDLDPAVLFHLHRVGGLPVDAIDDLLNHRSGLLGLTGDNDMRAVLRRRAAGDPAAGLAFDVYCRRIKEYVGAYLAVLGRLDAVTFTGGVGENAAAVRAAALAGLEGLGIVVDPERNERAGSVISPPTAPVAVCVVPTDEEREIAEQAQTALSGQPNPSGS